MEEWEAEKALRERERIIERLGSEGVVAAMVMPTTGKVTEVSVRRRIRRAHDVIPKVQALFRGQRVRSALVRLHYQAVVIQCAYRQWVARWTR